MNEQNRGPEILWVSLASNDDTISFFFFFKEKKNFCIPITAQSICSEIQLKRNWKDFSS